MSLPRCRARRAVPDIGAFAALTASGIDLSRIEDLGHGSTVATNAVLERKGALVAFIATAGFRDLLFMQRHDRRNIYDLFYAKPAPPVRRKDCFEVSERLRADGSIETALDEAKALGELIPALKAGGYRAVAVCLLNAYANPTHEQRLAALIAEALPGVLVTSSHQVAREFREFERASTTPALGLCAAGDRRLPASIRKQARRCGIQGPRFTVMQSNGGRLPARSDADERHHRALLRSGGRRGRRDAAGGVVGLQGPDHLRHGRHLDRRLPGAGRPSLARLGERDRRPADPNAGARHRVGRRGRRLARLGRRWRHVAGRPAKRRRRSRPGLLRQRRNGTRHHRCPHRHRHHPSGRVPGWPHEARWRCGAQSLCAACPTIRSRHRAGRRLGAAAGRRQHRARHPARLDRTRSRPARLCAGAVRRRGPAPCRAHRRGTRHRDHRGAAQPPV